MLKVALTGGIATGKSYVLMKLGERGVPTIDADDIVHEALRPKTPTVRAIALEFGSGVLQPDGSVDRVVLGEKVFSNPRARLRLEAITHPLVYETIRTWFETGDRPIGVASIPLLFETRREKDFDFVVVTACSQEQQLERIVGRGLSEEEAKLRMAAQVPTEDKVRRANFVISTAGTLAETDRQVDELVVELSKSELRSKK